MHLAEESPRSIEVGDYESVLCSSVQLDCIEGVLRSGCKFDFLNLSTCIRINVQSALNRATYYPQSTELARSFNSINRIDPMAFKYLATWLIPWNASSSVSKSGSMISMPCIFFCTDLRTALKVGPTMI